ncbi:serine/threonine-protein kinase [Streptomyces sp. NRRL WC-3742]|uniref:serine/threonine-protein kinase n=1 Tax=Streptomyces sp. NRRL WC-3742 TaxID=1463934 RepID=UPI000690C96A|nr:serine/threonine-protein kinase [Streptomyces sp. NRRL WC-3742]
MIGAGTVLNDRYRLTEPLGRGGMGTVWRAQDSNLKREVAVKILNAGLLEEPTQIERFRREAQVVAAIGHPGIVGVHDYGESRGEDTDGGEPFAYIVMDLIEGRALSTLLKDEGRMPPERALALVADALDALQAVHQRAIVHRDIKPSNLMVRADGALFVADFGIALAIAGTKITMTGGFVGTAAYMSPEQAAHDRANPITPSSDLYSMGVVCYEMLTGSLPFDGGAVQLAYKHVHQPAPELPATFPAPVRALVARALAKAPEDRFASAAEMAAAARTAAGLPGGEAGTRTVKLWKGARRIAAVPTQDAPAPAPGAEPVVKVGPNAATEPSERRRRRRMLVPVIIPVVVSLGTAGALFVDRNPFSSDAAPAPTTAMSTPAAAGPGTGTGTGVAGATTPVTTAPATPQAATTAPAATPDAAQPQPQQPVPAPPAAGGNGGSGAGGGANGGGTNSGGASGGNGGGTQARPPATNNNPAPPPPQQNTSSGAGASAGGGNPPPQTPARPPECNGDAWTRIVNVQYGAPIGLANADPNAKGNPVVLGGNTQFGWLAADSAYSSYNACNNNGARLVQRMGDRAVVLGDYMDILNLWVKTSVGNGAYTIAENGGANCLTANGVGSPLTMTACTPGNATQQWRFQK